MQKLSKSNQTTMDKLTTTPRQPWQQPWNIFTPARANETIVACENVISGMPAKPEVKDGPQPRYHPSLDRIIMPRIECFISAEHYYASFFHELAHSVGHASRLGRGGIGGSPRCDEIQAEITACFCSVSLKIANKTIRNSSAFIQGYASSFDGSKRKGILRRLSLLAQDAADYILKI